MNADPSQWSASQAERQAAIPRQARHRAPTSASAPNKGLRSSIAVRIEGLDPVQASSVQETKLAYRKFGVGTQQPGGGNKADYLPTQKREIRQTPLHSS